MGTKSSVHEIATAEKGLAFLPENIRKPLLQEYNSIIKKFMGWDFLGVGAHGGRFCEIVYCILKGIAKNEFPKSISKPQNMVVACQSLEKEQSLPKGLRLLVTRMLVTVYAIRNHRDISHVDTGVRANQMDSTVVVSMCSWMLAELVRTKHNLSAADAQSIVDSLSERKTPVIWEDGDLKKVLIKTTKKNQALILLEYCPSGASADDLMKWTGEKNKSRFKKAMKDLHKQRLAILKPDGRFSILPPGSEAVSKMLNQHSK